MDAPSIEHALDEAVRMLADGGDPKQVAQRWPAYQHELYPLLLVAQELLASGEESDEVVRHAADTHRAIDWKRRLSDVP